MSTRITARFELERCRQLKLLFTQHRLADLWRRLVKDQMRGFEIKDLHDYYDFNFAIEARADAIVERVLAGQYRAESPLVYRVEKKHGVCRHMMIPSPSDALVFQLLTDALYPAVKRAQPSKRAYYARARHTVSLPHEHQEARSYPWFILWPKFQTEIWNFSKAHPFLVTTDLTNYFDNIGLRELRHVISAIAKTKEVYLDLLFSLIEDLSWNPDYLPTSHKGLPTINIEAPRLLAHALLFEVDYLLRKRTRNNFVRWMDDINFGVLDRRSANCILGEINDVLKSRGLALNLSKTEVMTAKDAEFHFMFRENLRLSRVQDRARKLTSSAAKVRLAGKLQLALTKHIQICKARNKDKVTKRFLTILGILGFPTALIEAKAIYVSQPGLRTSVLNYLAKLPFSKMVAKTFLQLLAETDRYDDATRFGLVAAVVDWAVPRNSMGRGFVGHFRRRLEKLETTFDWLCWLYFLAKYGEPHEILNAVQAGKKFRAKEPFFARQRIAGLARAIGINPRLVLGHWRTEISTGYSDSASVANNLLAFSAAPFPTKQNRLYLYLFPTKQHRSYPLPKFLVLCAVAYSEAIAGKTFKRPEVAAHVNDPWYQHWLTQIHPIWF
jgi:reverse transcriptase-like protein